MVDVTLFLADESATEALGSRLASSLLKNVPAIKERGLNIRLNGNLGAGKTSLTRATLRALGYKKRVKSPTFTLLETYPLPDFQFNHFDFYRFEEPEEFDDLGFREYFGAGQIAASEWTQRAMPYVPAPDIEVDLTMQGEGRDAVIRAISPFGELVVKGLKQ